MHFFAFSCIIWWETACRRTSGWIRCRCCWSCRSRLLRSCRPPLPIPIRTQMHPKLQSSGSGLRRRLPGRPAGGGGGVTHCPSFPPPQEKEKRGRGDCKWWPFDRPLYVYTSREENYISLAMSITHSTVCKKRLYTIFISRVSILKSKKNHFMTFNLQLYCNSTRVGSPSIMAKR